MAAIKIKDFKLSEVTLNDPYCVNAFNKEVEYLISFDIDRLLSGFRETAGIDTKGKKPYPGWENMLIGGHCVGHYVSACSNAWNNPICTKKDALEKILWQMINGFEECQAKLGTGFLFGAQLLDKNNVELQFDNVEKGLTNIINQSWVPWYTMHKIIEGLLGVASLKTEGLKELAEKAEEILIKLTDWIYNRCSKWDEKTHKTVLSIEYGGMNDCLYSVYEVTGYKKALDCARFFDDEELFKTICNAKSGENILKGRHANTTIPKFIGALNRYIVTGEERFFDYAKGFWNLVTSAHSYITGGNSTWEHFGEDFNLYSKLSNCNCETCNSYNMLKLTKMLFMVTGEKLYADWYEHTFRNSILASQNPDTGMTTYFQPMGSGYFKVYNKPFEHFWCCTGTGMENFSKLGESFYFADENCLYVNQYISSKLIWSAKSVELIQTSTLPLQNEVSFSFKGKYTGKLAFRIPGWLCGNMNIMVNETQKLFENINRFAVIEGNFGEGDTIKIKLPMEIRAVNLPDCKDAYGFIYGPFVLSALLGCEDKKTAINGVAVTIPENPLIEEKYIPSQTDVVTVKNISSEAFIKNINQYLVRDEAEFDTLKFTLTNTDSNLVYIPHYLQCEQRYGLYFRFLEEDKVKALKEDKTSQAYINANKIDTVQPGYGQYENDSLHQMTEYGEGSAGQTYKGTSRHAKKGGSFSYRMMVQEKNTCVLVMFSPADEGKSIQIKAGTSVLFEGKIEIKDKTDFNKVLIPIPDEVISKEKEIIEADGKKVSVITFYFSGLNGEESAQICEFIYTMKK